MRIFGQDQRNFEEIHASEVNFSKKLSISNFIMPIDDFYDPFINCCFISDELIFVALHYSYDRTHYHFVWDLTIKDFWLPPDCTDNKFFIKQQLDCSKKNFPVKSFFNKEKM